MVKSKCRKKIGAIAGRIVLVVYILWLILSQIFILKCIFIHKWYSFLKISDLSEWFSILKVPWTWQQTYDYCPKFERKIYFMRINVKRVHLPQYKVLCHFLEEFENGGLSLKKHQMFSARNTTQEFWICLRQARS